MSFDHEKRAHKKRDKKSHDKGLTEKIYRKPQLFIYDTTKGEEGMVTLHYSCKPRYTLASGVPPESTLTLRRFRVLS